MFQFLHRLVGMFRRLRSELQAATAKYLIERQVVEVLKLTHASELMTYPRNEWPLVRQKQVEEIRAVSAGKPFDIVDRRSWAFPYLPEALHRLNQPILKNTPYNIRRFSETPIPRRAINLIKNAVLSLRWEVQPTSGEDDLNPEREQRIQIAEECLKRPNNTESFREWAEAGVEDFLLNGACVFEPRMTPYYQRPFKAWAVDSSTIRIFMDWTEGTPDRPRYAQMTGLKGERGIVTFLDSELIYIRDNCRTSTPFGLGKTEIAFLTINNFLGAQDMAGRAGADQVHKTWLWWAQTLQPGHVQTIRRHITNEIEGQAKVSIIAGVQKPEIVEVTPVTPEDLLIEWQKFMIDVIANAYDLSPMALGQTDHTNKAIGQVMADSDFRSAVVPTARRFEEAITRHLIHGFLGWKDLEFKFIDLDDPDALTKTIIQQRYYMMNSIVPDEIRKKDGKPPLPGGWGKLTFSQLQILTAAELAKLTGKGTMPSSSGSFGSGSGVSQGGGSGMGMGSSGMGGSMMSAADVAGMDPETIQLFQEYGILPPTQQLGDQMEQQQPGILETLTDELQQFFQHVEQVDEADEMQEAPITPADERQQLQKFDESQHQETLAEKSISKRGVFGPDINQQFRKAPERGKYPRSGGTFLEPNNTKDQTTPVVPKNKGRSKKVKKTYRPGRNNQYQ